MSNWVCSSALGLFHILNKKSCLNSPPPTSWGSHAQKSASVGGPLCGARKHHNILRSQHQNATNERPEILSETECQRWQTHRRQVRLQPSYLSPVNTTSLFPLSCFSFIWIPSRPQYTPPLHKQSASLLTFAPSYTHPSCFVFFPFLYQSHTFSPVSLPSSVSSLPCSLQCIAAAPTIFPPVGPCVCCNELYLIANWDPQP